MKQFLLTLMALVLTTALLFGCARQPAPTPTPTPVAPTPTPGIDEQLGEADPDNREEAEGADQTANTAAGIPDGEYEGRSDSDERGNYGIVRLTVENEQITEVVYEEYNGDDVLKSREGGYTYAEALLAFEELPQELIQTQNVAAVDDYTGATGTTNKFRTAAKRALGQGLAAAEIGEDMGDAAEEGE